MLLFTSLHALNLPLLLVSILSFIAITYSQTNLVTNGNFQYLQLQGWTCEGNTSGCGTYLPEGQMTYAAWIQGGSTLIQQTVAGDNIPYLLQYSAICNDTLDPTQFTCPCIAQLGNDTVQYNVNEVPDEIVALLQPSGDHATLAFATLSSSNWQLLLDNVTLWALAYGPLYSNANNLIQNGGFEKSTVSSGPDNGWDCEISAGCCSVNVVNATLSPQYAEEGLAYAELLHGCTLTQALSTEKDVIYDLTLYSYCLFDQNNQLTCNDNNLQVQVLDSNNDQIQSTQFTVPQGDDWSGPYTAYTLNFTASGNDTISITSDSHLRLDNFTLFVSTAPVEKTSSGSSMNVAAVIGGAVGGFVGLAIVVGLIMFAMRRKHKGYERETVPTLALPPTTNVEKAGYDLPPSPLSQISYTYGGIHPTTNSGTSHDRIVSMASMASMPPEVYNDDADQEADRYPSYRPARFSEVAFESPST